MEDGKNQIETIRYRRGLSQRELADRAGINVSTLSQIENGRVKPRAPTAFAIAQALGVPVDDLFASSVSGGSPEEMTSGGAEAPQDGRDDRTATNHSTGNPSAVEVGD
jgi:putative transcriptional regulator